MSDWWWLLIVPVAVPVAVLLAFGIVGFILDDGTVATFEKRSVERRSLLSETEETK